MNNSRAKTLSNEIVEKLRSAIPVYHRGWRQPEFEGWMEEQVVSPKSRKKRFAPL